METLVKTIWDRDKLETFFLLEGLFTETEIKEFETRLQIFKMLKDGHKQRDIASDLGVSITTVTRWAKRSKDKPKIKELI